MTAPRLGPGGAAPAPPTEEVPCPLCSGRTFRFVGLVDRCAWPFRIVRCVDCTLLHMNPRPLPAALDALYGDEYFAGEAAWSYADERRQEPQVRVRAGARLARVERMLARDGIASRRVVELGSAYGTFLDEARLRGWQTIGCDVSKDAAEWARRRRGLDVRTADLARAGLPDATADLVTGSEVVEHLAEPVPTAAAAFRVLRPGGVVLFSTANERSLARILRGPRWGYYMPGHVVLWSARTLSRLLRDAGFHRIRTTAGDERGLAAFRAFRRAGGPGSVAGWLARRVRLGGFTLGAGIVVTARKPGPRP